MLVWKHQTICTTQTDFTPLVGLLSKTQSRFGKITGSNLLARRRKPHIFQNTHIDAIAVYTLDGAALLCRMQVKACVWYGAISITVMTPLNGNKSGLLALCGGTPSVTDGFPSSQRQVTHSFDVFFDLRLNKRLSKQSRRLWFETPSPSLWLHCNDIYLTWTSWRLKSFIPFVSWVFLRVIPV